jgi:putative PIN family toxin of toxin-antitoxin system
MSMLRAVLDTNILVSALLSPFGNPAKVYKMFLTRTLTLVYSESILAEYKDVLYRPRLCIPSDDADIVLEAIRQYGEQMEPIPSFEPMTDDDDRVFI